MKHFLILILALGSLLAAAEPASKKSRSGAEKTTWWDEVTALFDTQEITLDTKLITADKTVSSLYTKQEGVANQQQLISRPSMESSVTFYVDVDKMLGGKKLKKGQKYRLDSLSWLGNPHGDFTGGDRKVIISNGKEALILPLPQTEKAKVTLHQQEDKTNFTFKRDDILEVTIIWRSEQNGSCAIRYFDAPAAPAVIRGTAMNLTPEGELPEGTGVDNKYMKRWRFNCPAVRIRATAAPEYNVKIIAISVLGVLGLILIAKLVHGARKDD